MELLNTYFVLKILALTVTAGFAVLGTTVDYKKEGQVTKYGRIAIIGVIVSGIISTTLLGFEEKAKADQQKQADDARVRADTKAKEDREDLNSQFNGLVNKATENIKTTTDTLDETRRVADAQAKSLEDQKSLMAQTKNISGGVGRSLVQQGSILDQVQGQVKLQRETFDQTRGIRKQTDDVLYNTLRALHSFKQFKIRYEFKIPLERFQRFADNLKTYAIPRIVPGQLNEPERLGIFPEKTESGKTFMSAVNILENSPYFSIIENTETHSDLTKSQLTMFFTNEKLERHLTVTTEAWAPPQKPTNKKLEEWSGKGGPQSQSFSIFVVYSKRGERYEPGIYVRGETNIVSDWTHHSNEIESFIDLPGSIMHVEIPEGGKVGCFEILTGETYGITYTLAPNKFKRRSGTSTVSYPFEKSDITIKRQTNQNTSPAHSPGCFS